MTKPERKLTSIETGPFAKGRLRDTRANLLVTINASKLTVAEKALVVEKIGLVDAKHNLLEIHFQSHAHRSGSNVVCTVTEL